MLISTKLRSLDPTLLYCIDSDWTPLSIGGIKLVSLGTAKFGVLGDKATVLVYMHGQIPIKNQWEIVFLLISTKLRSLDPTLLYCIDSDWTPLSIGGKKLVSLTMTKFGVLGSKVTVHV